MMQNMKRRRLMTALLFLLKLNILAIPLYAIMWLDISFPALQSSVAWLAYGLLRIVGCDVSLQSYTIAISSGSTSLTSAIITFDCTGWKSMYLLAALAIATPGIAWRKKALFISVALPAVFAVNIVRIATTIAAACRFGLEFMQTVHSLLWQEGLALVVIAIWCVWLRRELLSKKKTARNTRRSKP